jgi:hypothetical protein
MDTGMFRYIELNLHLTMLTRIHLFSKGLTAKQVEYAVTKYCSNRRVGPSIMMSLAMLDNAA